MITSGKCSRRLPCKCGKPTARSKEVSQQVGNLGSRWGEFVEGIVAPTCETLFTERGIPVHLVSFGVKAISLDGNHRMEIDLLVNNTGNVVLEADVE